MAPRTEIEQTLAGMWAELLRLERVGIHDNFFDLGGHSMLATLVMSRVQQAFQVEIEVRNLFEEPTVAELGKRIESALGGEKKSGEAEAIPRAERSGALPLSYAQERLWFLDQFQPGNDFYNVPMGFRLKGELDAGVLKKSLAEIVRRHEVLRTRFVAQAGGPAQQVMESVELEMPVVDLRHLEPEAREAQAGRKAADEGRKAFDLGRGPLLRVVLVRLADMEHMLVVTMHHSVIDAWSLNIFQKELAALYEAYRSGRKPSLKELPIQYGDYAVWQRQWLQGEVLERQMGYWKKQLEGMPGALELPTDRPRPAVQSFEGGLEMRSVAPELWEGLKRLSRQEGATLFMTLLAAYEVLLARYSGQQDFAVGTPVANRSRMETEGLIGFFLNTLVMRAKLGGKPSFRELLGRVRESALGGYAHQDVPFERLVEELAPERDLSRSPVFQVMFTLQNAAMSKSGFGGLEVSSVEVEVSTSKCDLLLTAGEELEGPVIGLNYNTELYDGETAQRMLGHYERLLQEIVRDAEQGIWDLPLLSGEEEEQQREWNRRGREYPRSATVAELFEEQARRRAKAIAVVCGEQEISYEELNRRSNQLGHYLRKGGVREESRVGICVERSLEMVVGLLGILKAGGAYVPLDPEYPQERLAWMVEDAGVGVLITGSREQERLAGTGARVVCLEQEWEAIAQESGEKPESQTGAEDLVYVTYTSGSTGQPKGVGVTQRNVVRLVKNNDYAQFSEGEVVLQYAPVSFDAATMELWGGLLNGGKLAVYGGGKGSLEELGREVRKQGVTTMWLTAGLFHMMVEERLEDLAGVRQLVAGGDVLRVQAVKKVVEQMADCRMINGYG
ncbi:MAG TPA: condensation domain-containing protein, partial [Gemmatimonadales bacterium]|nr:condensation domain-containing protein [Gemmatimonadales bacterium]